MNNETEQIFVLNAAPSQPMGSAQKLGSLELPVSSQVNLENVTDFSHVCRTCATITEFVIPIFAGEGLQNNLADKICKHLPIQVCEDDVLPLVVCYQCASTLLAWHELVKCCEQADAALRAKLSTNQQTSKPNTKSRSAIEEEAQSKLYTSVKNALDGFHNDLEEDNLDVEFVCQKCVEKPALTTMHSLAEHIKHDHSPDILEHDGVKTFITNYITFEQVLAVEDSDIETQSDTKEKSQIVLPSLHCPFCASVFSSPTRLVYHLNKHVELSIAERVVCCDHVYTNKKHFVHHLQEAHVVDRTPDDPVQVVCVSCGFTADHVEELRQHYKDEHNDVKNEKEKKIESPNNQKYIPAVCPECNKTFSNKYNMFVHMRSHTHTTQYACDKCARTYRNQGNLNHHKRLVHQGILNFLCLECGEAFPSRSERDIHSRIHTGETPFKCEHCGKSYRAKNTLNRHLEIHLDIRKYDCEICAKKFRKKSHLDYHIKTHMKFIATPQYVSPSLEPPEYREPRGPRDPRDPRAAAQRPCTYCTSSHHHTMYKEHLVTAHSDLLFHCEECGKYIDRKDFILHMSLHAVQYTSGQDKSLKRKKIKKKKEEVDVNQNTSEVLGITKAVDTAVQVVDTKRNVSTAVQVVNTKRNVSLENEFSDHSETDGFEPLPESVFEAIEDSQDSQPLAEDTSHAPENENNTSQQPALENDKLSNPALCMQTSNFSNCAVVIERSNISNYVLPVTSANINNAVLPANGNSDTVPAAIDSDQTDAAEKSNQKKTRTCPICHKIYTASSSYFYHMKYFHKGSREHGCEVCGKRFGTRSSLTQHMAIHTGQYEFECKLCLKRFKSKASLYIHEQTHNGKKSWSCNQCHTSFRWKTHLSRHMKRHSAEKGHICTTCGRGFTIRCDLLRHARTHTAGSFTCDKCGQKFAQLRYLKVHTMKQHSTNIVKESQ